MQDDYEDLEAAANRKAARRSARPKMGVRGASVRLLQRIILGKAKVKPTPKK